MNHRVRRLPKLIVGLMLLGCAAGSGLLSTAWAYIPPAGHLPRLDIDMSLQFPDTVRTGDTVSISMTYRLLQPIPEPERGAATFASINWAVRHCHGSFQFLDYAPWIYDTLSVGDVRTIERKIVPTKPGCAAVVGAVTSGIPWKTVRDTSYWGAGRFRNQVFDTVTIIGDSLDLTKVAIRHLPDGTPLLQPNITRSGPLASPQQLSATRHLPPGQGVPVNPRDYPLTREVTSNGKRLWVFDWTQLQQLANETHDSVLVYTIPRRRDDTVRIIIRHIAHELDRPMFDVSHSSRPLSYSTDSLIWIPPATYRDSTTIDTVHILEPETGIHLLIPLRISATTPEDCGASTRLSLTF